MILRRAFALLAALVLLAAPAGRAAEPEEPQPAPSSQQQPPPRHFLWKAVGAKGGGTVFLFGTIHAGTADLYPLAPIIEDSFKKADVLVEEVDIKSDKVDITDFIAQNGAYPRLDSITNHLGETTRDWLAAYATANHIGPEYIHLKPWVMTVMIGQIEAKRFGLDKEKGLDLHFAQEAAAAHKPVEAFETAEFQLKLLSGFSDNMQDQMLFGTLLEAKRSAALLREMLAAWKSGDAAALDDIDRQEERRYPSLQAADEKILYERNDTMTHKIEDLLKTGKTYFVAVGAGHLAGDRGIVNQLRAKNYTVEQL